MQNKIIKIGSRSSKLALFQTHHTIDLIQEKHHIDSEVVNIRTKGDAILDVALYKIGDKGLFTQEIESALLNQTIDCAVHSAKDMQTRLPEGLYLSAFLNRDDPRDALVINPQGQLAKYLSNPPQLGYNRKDLNHDSITLPNLNNMVIGSSSVRRESQIKRLFPKAILKPIRGNIDSRLQKMVTEGFDAIVLAKAGLDRLRIQANYYPIHTEQMLPAVAQGIICIESCLNNSLNPIFHSLSNPLSTIEATVERDFLYHFNGGCSSPIGCLVSVHNNTVQATAEIITPEFNRHRASLSVPITQYLGLGEQLANSLKEKV